MKSNLSPIKERIDPNDLPETIVNSSYPKPRWMLNESINDKTWYLSKVGISLTFYKGNINKAQKFEFKQKIADNEYLTDKINEALLIDIRNSLLYLDITGKITRPARISDIAISVIHLIYHANELRISKSEPLVRSLEQIKFKELKHYLLSFNVERDLFEKAVNFILIKWSSKRDINWSLIKTEFALTTREFKSLKCKIIKYLESKDDGFTSKLAYKREYNNACIREFDIEFDLYPSQSTISNEISKLEAFFTARTAQKYKFQYSPIELFSVGRTIFDEMIDSVKTPLMPISLSLHTTSSALHFARVYGEPLRQYISDLSKGEVNRIIELGIALSTSRKYHLKIKNYVYKTTKIPDSLKPLIITSWEKGDDSKFDYSELRKGMSVNMAIRLYTAAIWILIASFSAGRTTSLRTLNRNCFVQSPVDGLFDIVMKIPKSSERLELEKVYRPIPDLIYDYGLEFALMVCELEERRGFIGDENELFLFGCALSYRSISAAREDGGENSKHPLSADYINASINMFMDWIESPLIDGKRWYPSTHQFRRLFAVVYFNFSDQVGLDELSWFMGHSNLDQTFYYAEVSPDDEWIDEAEATIARIGASLNKHINGDEAVRSIVNKARQSINISTVLETLVRRLIDEHKEKTGQQVRFCKIDGNEVFFYFIKP